MKILKIFLILSSLFLFVNADDEHHKYKHSYKNLEYLDLNKEQLENIKNTLIDFKHKYKDFYEYKEHKEDELKDIMKADIFDEKKYLEILNDIKTKASLLEIEKIKNIHTILDKKQRKKFSKYLQEWEVE
jgi:Spy/CpxP family protein refolding chaperone